MPLVYGSPANGTKPIPMPDSSESFSGQTFSEFLVVPPTGGGQARASQRIADPCIAGGQSGTGGGESCFLYGEANASIVAAQRPGTSRNWRLQLPGDGLIALSRLHRNHYSEMRVARMIMKLLTWTKTEPASSGLYSRRVCMT